MYAVASSGEGADALMADRFGRAEYFSLFDGDGNYLRSIKNDTTAMAHGAGGQAVAAVASEGVKVVIGPQFGPNAESAMKGGGLSAFMASGCTASKAVSDCIAGKLKKVF